MNEGPVFLFAHSPGFRFLGRLLGDKPGPVELILTPTGEKPVNPLKTQPPPLPHPAELPLARRVLDPYVAQVLKSGDLPEKIRMLEALARVEPERVLELAEKEKFPDPFFPEMFRLRVVEGLAYDDPDEAVSVAEAMQSPWPTPWVTSPSATPCRLRQRLAPVSLSCWYRLCPRQRRRSLTSGCRSSEWSSTAGSTWAKRKRPRSSLARDRKSPGSFPVPPGRAGYAVLFAEELAQIDLAAALALTKDLSDPREFDRHHGNIAHELAGMNPAEAERIWRWRADDRQRGSMSVRVCYRMALVDLHRRDPSPARSGSRNSRLRAGRDVPVASSIRQDEDHGRRAAYRGFRHAGPAGGNRQGRTEQHGEPPATAASLLPAAEAIDPDLVPEYLARSLALRRPTAAPEADPSQGWFLNQTTARLAMRLARYDHATARALLDPLVRRIASGAAAQLDTVAQEVIVACSA